MIKYIKNKIKLYKVNKIVDGMTMGLAGPDPFDSRDFLASTILQADVALPSQYVVPHYRHWFDSNFNVLPDVVRQEIKCQWSRGSCVSQAYARQKEAQEKVSISARYNHSYCKLGDGYPHEGTYLRTSQKVGVDYGAAEEKLYPEPGPEMSYAEYTDVTLIPENVEENAKGHKAQSYFSVRGWNEFMQMMFQHDSPIQTGCQWYKNDNAIDDCGIFPQAGGSLIGGHSFDIIGWKLIGNKTYLIMVNSWGNIWADNGLAYISQEVFPRLYDGWMTVDIKLDIAILLQKYNGKNVKVEGNPDIYFISNGSKHSWVDEMVWWSNGNYFAGGFLIIPKEELDIIPLGEPMTFNWKNNWAPAQIKELLNLIGNNPERAKALAAKYFG